MFGYFILHILTEEKKVTYWKCSSIEPFVDSFIFFAQFNSVGNDA